MGRAENMAIREKNIRESARWGNIVPEMTSLLPYSIGQKQFTLQFTLTGRGRHTGSEHQELGVTEAIEGPQ